MTNLLYRHFSADGTLLYCGISLDAITRQGAHERLAGWFKQVRRIEITSYPTRTEAAAAEIVAIQNEKPRHNRQHSDDPSKPRLGGFIISDVYAAAQVRGRSRRASP
jgi:excinuclease UvrABC nuclease subunit